MTFVHPWAIWIGVVAAAGPVAVHLLTRPRPVRMPLSTLRFAREAVRFDCAYTNAPLCTPYRACMLTG